MPRRVTQFSRDGSSKVCEINKNHVELPRGEEYITGNDPCPVCEENLFASEDFTKRIAILDEGDILGWICPECFTEFDMESNVKVLFSKQAIHGEG